MAYTLKERPYDHLGREAVFSDPSHDEKWGRT